MIFHFHTSIPHKVSWSSSINSGTPCIFEHPSKTAEAVPECCPKSSFIYCALLTFGYLLELPSGVIARGLQTWAQI